LDPTGVAFGKLISAGCRHALPMVFLALDVTIGVACSILYTSSALDVDSSALYVLNGVAEKNPTANHRRCRALGLCV